MRKRIGYLVGLIVLLQLMVWGCSKNQSHANHEYGEWQVVTAATCTEDGEQERVCSCGEKETEVIPATGHVEVKDAAVKATCLTAGKTEGSHCSVCQMAIKEQKVIKPQHKEYTLEAVGVTCTRAGKGEGIRCSECGAVIQRQKKIRATGHTYKNGKCTKCGELQPDLGAAILVDQLNEDKESNFITKKAYPGGSTITFWAYVPKGVSWWAVSWTTNQKKIGLYDWAEENGMQIQVKAGSWQKCSVTLPQDKKNYYIYLVGAKGEWKGMELLIDDVVITNANGKVVAKDDFSNGLETLFHVVKTNPSTQYAVVYEKQICAKHHSVTDKAVAATCDKSGLTKGTHCKSCGKVLTEQKVVEATGHRWKNGKCTKCGKKKENLVAALVVDQLNDSAPMNFITKKAYKGGSTVTFKAYIPKNVKGWAAIAWTTDPSKAGLYDWTTSGKQIQATPGEWTECSVELPKDGKNYYLYFVGEKGQYKGKELLIDAFKITGANGKVLAEDDFDNGLANSIFEIVSVNPTSGALVVYDKTGEDPCKNGHKIVTDKAVKATCTKVGKTAGKHCSVCDTILVAQEEIPALGHDYNEEGICKRCGDKIVNRAVSIQIDQLNEANEMNFITRKPYAGGSTVTFKAYVPAGTTWWAVSWATNPTDTDLYKWAEGKGASQSSVYNKWATYTVTLPDDGNNYYLYIVGEKGKWGGKCLQIDDVKITNKLGEIVGEDNFNAGMNSGLFKIIETNPTTGEKVVKEVKVGDICMHKNLDQEENVEPTCTEPGLLGRTYCKDCGETIHEATVLEKLGHDFKNGKCDRCGEPEHKENKAIAIKIDELNENDGQMNFITKKTYKGGSVITFQAYVPSNTSWWTVCWTTDPSKANLYGHVGGDGKNMAEGQVTDAWAEYTVTLPDDGKDYYIFIAGAKTEWKQKDLLIDDFKIKTGETVVVDDFNGELKDSIFHITAVSPGNGNTVISQVKVKDPNYAAAIKIDMLNESGNMNFITKSAYKGGSTITFKAYVPKGVTWWAVSWTTDPSDTGLYQWTEGKGKAQSSVEDSWATYTVTLPKDDNSYYIYIVGEKGQWGGKQLLIDDVKITSETGDVLAEETFQGEFADSIFNILTGEENMIVSQVTVKEENLAAVMKMDLINAYQADGSMNFMTKKAYKGGTTITFQAYVPSGTSWWAVSWTTDPAVCDAYNFTQGLGKAMTSVEDHWATYTVTLPDDGNDYYVYITGAKGEWNQKELMLDDFTFTTGTETEEDDFNQGLTDGLFDVVEKKNDQIVVYTKKKGE